MNLLNFRPHHLLCRHNPYISSSSSRNLRTNLLSDHCSSSLPNPHGLKLSLPANSLSASTLSFHPPILSLNFKHGVMVSNAETPSRSTSGDEEGEEKSNLSTEYDDLAPEGEVYKKTLRLVECSMFAAVCGLAYFLSNSLSIDNYFGCLFALPVVMSSMRWGIAAGRKTMVATALLLLVLSGPVKALTYLLMHGLPGFAMGSMWRLRASWGVSILFCSTVRAMCAMGYVLMSSFLIRENILALITINVHASLTLILTSLGFQTIPSMDVIYTLFGTLLLLNCGSFVFLLHLLYAVVFVRLGMKPSLRLPRWLEAAI